MLVTGDLLIADEFEKKRVTKEDCLVIACWTAKLHAQK